MQGVGVRRRMVPVKDQRTPGKSGHRELTGEAGLPGLCAGHTWALIHSEEPSAHPCLRLLGPTWDLGSEGQVTGSDDTLIWEVWSLNSRDETRKSLGSLLRALTATHLGDAHKYPLPFACTEMFSQHVLAATGHT